MYDRRGIILLVLSNFNWVDFVSPRNNNNNNDDDNNNPHQNKILGMEVYFDYAKKLEDDQMGRQ